MARPGGRRTLVPMVILLSNYSLYYGFIYVTFLAGYLEEYEDSGKGISIGDALLQQREHS